MGIGARTPASSSTAAPTAVRRRFRDEGEENEEEEKAEDPPGASASVPGKASSSSASAAVSLVRPFVDGLTGSGAGDSGGSLSASASADCWKKADSAASRSKPQLSR